jgi:DNA-binding response OmpR family regulator
MTTVLIVEDDPIIRQTVEYALKREGFETHATDNGSVGLEMARVAQPELVLLDLMLPGLDGYSFARELRRDDQEVAIIMLTALGEDRDKVRGLDAGADDYLTKPFSMDELLARIRANLRRVREREMLTQDEIVGVGDLSIDPAQFRVTVSGEPVKLRMKEFQLLHTLASNPGDVMTRQRLAREVWGYDFLPSSRTIDVHIRRLRQAVEDVSAYLYIHTVHGVGYRFEPQPKDAVVSGGG